MKLQGKTVLVTGSTDGLGRQLALELAKQGANVIVHGKDSNRLIKVLSEVQKINSHGSHTSVLCDFRDPTSIQKAI